MRVNMNNLVSITEANQNFSKVTRMVDEKGPTVILKNNKPKYVVIPYDHLTEFDTAVDEDLNSIAKKYMTKHRKAFQELAK